MSATDRNLERWEELVCDQTLFGLAAEEREELEALVGDDLVEAELMLFELAAGEVAASAFAAQDEREGLSPALMDRLERRLNQPRPERVARGASVPVPARVLLADRRPRAWTSRLPWLLAAAAFALALGAWVRSPVSRVVPPPVPEEARTELLATAGTVKIDLKPTADPAATRAAGDVSWHAGLQRGFMRINGLAPNDPKVMQYQLWIFDAEREDAYPVDGGVFDVVMNARGEVVVPIQAKLAVGKPKLFAITVEKPGGVVVSKRERIVLTASPS